MVPKFRGGGDDWLDDEGAGSIRSSQSRPKKTTQARAVGLSPDEANAVVAEVFPNQCRVRMDLVSEGKPPEVNSPDAKSHDLLCSYRRAGVVAKGTETNQVRERSPVAVGDRVLAKSTGSGTGIIEGICTRKNSLSRPAPGRDSNKHQHVLAANVDVLVVVASVLEPEFSVGLVDRFLVAAEIEGISAVLCITKLDLWNTNLATPTQGKPWSVYPEIGYDLYEVCAKKETGLSALFDRLVGKTVVFCGHSGVGKTSLLRMLLKSEVGRVGAVNEMTGKGRHTTTGAVLLGGPQESKWIDTPGVRAFGLTSMTPERLAQGFPEFRTLQCPQAGCLHQDEEGCLARSLVRYTTYRRILDSILAGEN